MKRRKSTPCYLSPKALALPELPAPLRKVGRDLHRSEGAQAFCSPVVVAFASELVLRALDLPAWGRSGTTRYLVVVDVPEAVLPTVISRLELRKPELRLHTTRDVGAIRRLLVASIRREPMLGIIDAYAWNGSLNLLTGDFEFRSFPMARIPQVADLPDEERHTFEIGTDGSRLIWPAGEIHLGVSQILQDADPMYKTDIAILRNGQDRTGAALRRIREENGLRQADIPGLSDRQVRRIEEGISRLTVPAAERYATAFGIKLGSLLDQVAARAGAMQQSDLSRRGTVEAHF